MSQWKPLLPAMANIRSQKKTFETMHGCFQPTGGIMNLYPVAILAVSALPLYGCGSHASSANSVSSGNAASPANAASSGDAWTIQTNVDQMTSQKTTFAVDTAQSPLTNSYGMQYTPKLALACVGPTKNQAGIYLDLEDSVVIDGDPANNKYTVNVRLDGNQESAWNVASSSDGKGYFFDDPAKFLAAAGNAKHMLLGFTTAPDSQKVVIDFDISGMNDAARKLPCHS